LVGSASPSGAQALGCLAFRRPVVADAFFRHQARRGAGNGAAQVAGSGWGKLAAWHGAVGRSLANAAGGRFRCPGGGGHSRRDRIRFIISRNGDMHIHILGICGTFMGGIALLARAAAIA
jgi:hypothetical protein